jgi:N utilization substance protein B
MNASQPQDLARLLGLRIVYPVQGGDDTPCLADETPEPGEEALESLTPEQRERAFNVATRRLIVQALYAMDASSLPTPLAALDAMLSRVDGLGPVGIERVRELATKAYQHRVTADAELSKLSPDWSMHRMPGMDRAILRYAHFEMCTFVTHPRIAINEAVELARWFSTEKSPSFVNALLDKVLKRITPEWEAKERESTHASERNV